MEEPEGEYEDLSDTPLFKLQFDVENFFNLSNYRRTVACVTEIESRGIALSYDDLWFRGCSYDYLDLREESVQDYTRAIELEPDNPRAYLFRGHVYTRFEKDDLAVQDYAKVLEMVPGNWKLRVARAAYLARLDRYDEAIEEYDRVLSVAEAEKSRDRVLCSRATMYLRMLRDDLAHQDIDEATKSRLARCIFQRRQYAISDRSVARMAWKEYDEALEDLDRLLLVLSSLPDDNHSFAIVRMRRAFVLCQMDRFSEAREDLFISFKMDPTFPRLEDTLAVVPHFEDDMLQFVHAIGMEYEPVQLLMKRLSSCVNYGERYAFLFDFILSNLTWIGVKVHVRTIRLFGCRSFLID